LVKASDLFGAILGRSGNIQYIQLWGACIV